jgi:hypothetical protein
VRTLFSTLSPNGNRTGKGHLATVMPHRGKAGRLSNLNSKGRANLRNEKPQPGQGRIAVEGDLGNQISAKVINALCWSTANRLPVGGGGNFGTIFRLTISSIVAGI